MGFACRYLLERKQQQPPPPRRPVKKADLDQCYRGVMGNSGVTDVKQVIYKGYVDNRKKNKMAPDMSHKA